MKKPNRAKRIVNKRAAYGYLPIGELEIGMVLTGEEIKAIRAGHMHLTGSYGRILQGPNRPELWLVGAQISGTTADPQRSRKLLAHRREIDRLIGLVSQKGYTLVPKRVIFKSGRAKLILTISKGLKVHEKRQKIKDRDVKRDIARSLRKRLNT